MDRCLDTLEHCTFLESLHITLSVEPNARSARAPLSLPHLCDLYVSFQDGFDIASFLQPLHLPRVCTFEFYQRRPSYVICEAFWTAFRAFLARSRPPLHELCVGANSAARVLTPILTLLPTLEILDFRQAAPDPATLVALTPAPGGLWLCLRLRALYLVNVRLFDNEELISLVQVRVPPGPWDGGGRPVGPSEGDEEVTEGRYLTELGVWNAMGVTGRVEKKLQALGHKGGDKMRFTIQRHPCYMGGHEWEARGDLRMTTPKQFR